MKIVGIKKGFVPLLFSLCFWNCQPKEIQERDKSVFVNIVAIDSLSQTEQRQYVGTVEESYASMLSFEVAGNVKQVFVKEGQTVKKGQLLAVLDDRTARNAYQSAKATLERAQDGYRRAEQVYKNGSLAEVKWVEIQTSLVQAESVYGIAKKNLEDCQMKAPVDGIIGEKSIDVGMNVLPYQPALKLLNITQMYVKVSIPENEIASIDVGQKADIMVSAIDNAVFSGTIEQKGVNADPMAHSYMVRIKLDKTAKGLMPGMVSKVFLFSKDSLCGIEIPNRAVQLANNGERFVWLKKNGLATQQVIAIGDLTENGVLISQGLHVGDSVIVDGFDKLSRSISVKVK